MLIITVWGYYWLFLLLWLFFANVFNGSEGMVVEGMRDVSINPLEGKLVPLEEWQQHLNTRFVCSPR